jgi:hypothetical protein
MGIQNGVVCCGVMMRLVVVLNINGAVQLNCDECGRSVKLEEISPPIRNRIVGIKVKRTSAERYGDLVKLD